MQKKLKILEHALAASAGAYYSINLTRNLVPGTMYQVINDKEYSLNEQMGLDENAAFTDVVSYWGEKLDSGEQPAYYDFLAIENLLERYHKGEAYVSHQYWTKSAIFEPMFAEQHIVMYKDEETGDILAITYILDLTQKFKEEQYKKELEKKQENLKRSFEEQKRQKIRLENALADARLNSEIISSISKLYWLIYRMDLTAGTYEEVSAGDEMHTLTGKRGKTAEVFREARETIVSAEYQEIMEEFLDTSTLSERLKDTESVSVEYRAVSGSWHLARFIVKKRDPAGNVLNVLYVVRQIDKEKQLETKYKQELIEHNRVLSGLSLDHTIAFVLNLDTDDYKIIFNQKTNHAKVKKDITKFADYVDEYAESFVLPEFQDAMRRELGSSRIKKRFETEEEYYFSFETIPNTAGLSCFQAHIVKEYDGEDHFAFLGFRSVDEIVKQERFYKDALQKANEALKQQLDMITFALPGGVKISNDDETYSFKYVSEQFANMLGYETPEELMAASRGSIAGLAHPEDLESGIAEALDQYSRADHYEITYRMRCKDGSWKYIEDRGHKFYTPDGTVEHWNLILDKNDLMKKSIALESERKANQSKSDFLSRMSHDMRTPLNGIIGLLKINQDHFNDRKLVMENHRKMQVAADHLLSLINDVLQMSKIEDGNVVLTHEIIDLNELTHEIMTIIGERAEEKRIQLEFKKGNVSMPYPYIYGSPVHLRQIFLNIYGNCIKYNRVGGKVTTTAELTQGQEGTCICRWMISDTGIGMSEGFIKHIFEPFVQEKDDARSIYTGVGLGMSIARGMIKQMGGTISVKSKEGVGSTFIITIPFEIAPAPEDQKEQKDVLETNVRGLNLMLVEDNELNSEIAETMLTDEGAEVTVVRDGKQAVDLFAEEPEDTFDAILMDIMMPVMDGLTATRTIRSLKRTDAGVIPIIAMTANAFREDGEKCLEAGMNAHLTKPLNIEEVKRTIYMQVRNQKK